jgi:uncharacterized protein YndB with AHSA1/START domain
MKSLVELDIQAPCDEVAALFADPANLPKWMHDLERYEPIQGMQGTPGSRYRMVPKSGDMVFVATVLSRSLPEQVILRLDGKNIVVLVTDRFIATSPGSTRMVSEEEFRFTTLFSWLFGFVAQHSIRKAHRQHIESFKQFAEQENR